MAARAAATGASGKLVERRVGDLACGHERQFGRGAAVLVRQFGQGGEPLADGGGSFGEGGGGRLFGPDDRGGFPGCEGLGANGLHLLRA